LAEQPDIIYVASWNPGGATAIRQLRDAGIETPIVGPAALDGQLLIDVVGDVSDVFYTPFACVDPCTGQDSEALDAFIENFEAETGNRPSTSYALLGYNMMSAIAEAFELAASTDGPDVRDALQELGPIETPIGETQYFSETCHKIIDMPLSVLEVSGGEVSFVETFVTSGIPDIDDGNACATT
jgi:branched-chain amino acid transport system substrate-binding protein